MTAERPPSSARRRGLGRGLGALLPSMTPSTDTNPEATVGRLIEVDPHTVASNPEQPRRHFDEVSLAELAGSLRAHGLLQPIVVEPTAAGGYQLVAGERRLRAARQAGLATIPAVVRPVSESGREALELALVENLQRADLSGLEEAAAYSRLADTFGLTHEAIGLRVGRSRAAVTNTIRLLGLSAPVQEALRTGRISAGHARALLALRSPAEQQALAERAAAEELTVREVEQAVASRLHATDGPQGSSRATPPAPRRAVGDTDDLALVRALEDELGCPVHLHRTRRGGRLTLSFVDDEMLDALYTRLGGPAL